MTDFNASERLRDVEHIRKYPHHCSAEVTRNGESEPCDKIAVAVCGVDIHDDGEFDPLWWPVCAYHTRKGHAVPLAELFEAMAALRG